MNHRKEWYEKYKDYPAVSKDEPMKKPNKYRNTKCEYQGIKFHSQREMNRYIELSAREKAGEIARLRLQPRYEIVPKCGDNRAVHYIADFEYVELIPGYMQWHTTEEEGAPIYEGKLCVEDAKGMKTKDYIIKKKLMKWLKHIDIIEI